MGGRGAVSGIGRLDDVFPNAYSRDLSTAEVRGAVANQANFILRNLEQDEAVQVIIRRSFRGGIPQAELQEGVLTRGLTTAQARNILTALNQWIVRFNADYRSEQRRERNSASNADRTVHQVNKQTIADYQALLKEARRKLRRNYKL